MADIEIALAIECCTRAMSGRSHVGGEFDLLAEI